MNVEILQTILERTEGCIGILINGLDGFVIEKVWRDGTPNRLDFTVAVAEYTSVVELAMEKNREIGLGGLSELTISNDSGVFLMRVINEDQFLAMILSPEGNIGRARYELQQAEFLLQPALAL